MLRRIFCLMLVIFKIYTIEASHETPAFPLDSYLLKDSKKTLRILYQFETLLYTKITVLSDKKSNKLIVKQDTKNSLHDTFKCAMRDTIAALVARAVGVRANHVTFIPSGTSFPGKDAVDFPATLHDFVPGIAIKQLPKTSRWYKICIHQYTKDEVPLEKWGLTRTVIKNMSQHEDLCKIAAVDTFTANSDRSLNNYFYDEKTNHFYAIDFECSFRREIASYACKTIEHMLHNKHEKITPQEYIGLKIYRDTLNQLIELYPPHIIQEYFFTLAQRGSDRIAEQQQIVTSLNKRYAPKIEANYEGCKQLVSLLDQLLK